MRGNSRGLRQAVEGHQALALTGSIHRSGRYGSWLILSGIRISAWLGRSRKGGERSSDELFNDWSLQSIVGRDIRFGTSGSFRRQKLVVLLESCVIGVDDLLDELGMLFCVFLASAADRYNNLSCVYCGHFMCFRFGRLIRLPLPFLLPAL